MKKTTKTITVVACLLFAIILSGCSSNSGADSTNQEKKKTTTSYDSSETTNQEKEGTTTPYESSAIGESERIMSFSLWDGSIASKFEKGNGSQNNPFIIATASQLAYMAEYVNSGQSYEGEYYTLACDIDLDNREWTPIGTDDNPFVGNFYGSYHVIENMRITEKSSYIGLFGKAVDSKISHTYVKDGTIILDSRGLALGGVVGSLESRRQPFMLEECISDCMIILNDEFSYVGGIIGTCDGSGEIINSVSSCYIDIASDHVTVGGIVGEFDPHTRQCTIKYCTALGYVHNNSTSGGIVGRIYGRGGTGLAIKYCVSAVTMDPMHGGIIGYCGDAATASSSINNCLFSKKTGKTAVSSSYNDPQIQEVHVVPLDYFVDDYVVMFPTWLSTEYLTKNTHGLFLSDDIDGLPYFPENWWKLN